MVAESIVADRVGQTMREAEYYGLPKPTILEVMPNGVTVRRWEGWTSYLRGDYYVSIRDGDGQIEESGFGASDLAYLDDVRAVLSHPDLGGPHLPQVRVELVSEDGRAYTAYSCDGVTVCDDPNNGLDVDTLIDNKVYSRVRADGQTIAGCTDLAGLRRIHAALGAIINHIETQSDTYSHT